MPVLGARFTGNRRLKELVSFELANGFHAAKRMISLSIGNDNGI
jgi:hypothetical protein